MGLYSNVVACEEVHGSKKESASLTGFNASVSLKCAYADRYDLVDDLISNARSWPDFALAKARQASISPVYAKYTTPAGHQTCEYEDAVVTVTYSTEADRDLITESIEPTAEFRTLDHRNYRWSSANGLLLNENETPGQLIRGLNIVRTLHNVPAVPAALLTLPGTVNLAAYTSVLLGLTFAPETLLFGIQPITRSIKLSGSTGYNVTVKMSYKASTWNRFWNQKTNSYEPIYEYGGGVVKPYVPLSFSDFLF
jgi:hypothetical protein